MTDGFSNFKNKATGEVVYLPTHYADLFPDTLELTDEDVECTTCNLPDEPVDEAEPPVEPFSAPVEIDIAEPARRSRRSRNSDS